MQVMFQHGNSGGDNFVAEIIDQDGDLVDLMVETKHGAVVAYGVPIVDGPLAAGSYKCWVKPDA